MLSLDARATPIALIATLAFGWVAACGDSGSTTSASTGNTGGDSQGGSGGAGGLGLTTSTTGSGGDGAGGSVSCDPVQDGGAAEWANGYSSGATVADVAVDSAGNAVVIGSYTGTLTIGATTLTSNASDVFVAKFGPTGTPIWANSFGAAANQVGQAVAIDSDNNIIIVGQFLTGINFGGGNIPAAGNLFEDMFVAKLNPNGGQIWANGYGDGDVERAKGVAVNAAGEIAIVGQYKGGLNLGAGALPSTSGDFDFFVAKLSAAGAGIWSRSFGDGVEQDGNEVAFDSAGDVLVAGDFSGAMAFGSTMLTAEGESSLYVAKLSGAAGEPVWANGYGDGLSPAEAIAVDGDNNVFVGGQFFGSIDFGSGPVLSMNGDDAYLVKFTPAGAVAWSRSYGTNSPQTLGGLGVTASDEVVLAGTFGGSINFGGGAVMSEAGSDIYVAKLGNSDGCPLYSNGFGGPGDQLAQAATVLPTGEAVVAGTFTQSIDFGNGPIAAGGVDLFVARFEP